MWHKSRRISRLKHGVYELMNRPGLRPGLAALSTILASARMGEVCRTTYGDGQWIQMFPTRTLVEPRLSLWTPAEIEKWANDLFFYRYCPSEGHTIIDVGAGTGWETLLFSRGVGKSGRVISIEAHPSTFRCLSQVCLKNRLDNVTLIEAAIGDHERDLWFSDDAGHEGNAVATNQSGIRVRGTTLEYICRTQGLSCVDFLKMNIEGAERSALSGMGELARKTKHVCISCHDFLANGDAGATNLRTKADVVRFLSQHGFTITLRESDRRSNVRDFVYGLNEHLVTN
jgi:FkbM family methyltransferase